MYAYICDRLRENWSSSQREVIVRVPISKVLIKIIPLMLVLCQFYLVELESIFY